MTMDAAIRGDRLDDELGRVLKAYAEVRLSPDQWAGSRMRVEVIERAYAASLRRSRSRVGGLRFLRPAAFVVLVGVLSIGSGATAAIAASPGGPLYGTRLWIEAATLPAAGDARTDAQAAQLDERVDEATVSADEMNDGGVAAALGAYEDEVDTAIADAGQNAGRLQHLATVLSKHIAVLQGLDKSNPAAAAAIQHAIAESQKALDRIEQALAAAPSGAGGNGGGNGTGGGNGNGGGQGTGGNGNGGGNAGGNGGGQPSGPPGQQP